MKTTPRSRKPTPITSGTPTPRIDWPVYDASGSVKSFTDWKKRKARSPAPISGARPMKRKFVTDLKSSRR